MATYKKTYNSSMASYKYAKLKVTNSCWQSQVKIWCLSKAQKQGETRVLTVEVK